MEDRCLYRLQDDGLVEHAALGAFMTGIANDMVVDDVGRAYVGNFGFDLFGGGAFHRADLVMVTPDGGAGVAARDLSFPNGTVILPERRMLVVAETMAARLTAFDIGEDGGLSNRRVFADLCPQGPDGICLDAEGGIWAGAFNDGVFLRVLEGGRVTDRVAVPGRRAVTCQLGGEDGRTLFCLTYEGELNEVPAGRRAARVEVATVDTPGAGSP
jgi:sugar lactone lactonase YvrE